MMVMKLGSFRLRNWGVTLGALLFFLLASEGCVEDPNSVGANLLPPSDLLKIDTTAIFAQTSFVQESIPFPSFTRTLIGKTGDVEAWGLLRFLPLPDTLRGVTIVSAQVEMRTLYHFGDSLGAYSFSVHRVLRDWKGDSLTIDSLKAPGFYQTSSIGSLNAGSVGDTATISVRIDTGVVRSWLDTVGDTLSTNHGIVLRPTSSSVVKGFATFNSVTESFRPKLVVYYARSGSTRIDTVRVSTGIARFVAKTSSQILPNDSLRFQIRNAIVRRSILKFSVSSIPPRSPIHQAVLEIRLDHSLSRLNSYTADSLNAYFMDKDGIVFPSRIVSETTREGTSTVYRFQIGLFVQQWVRNSEFTTVALGGFDEASALDVFVLHGPAAPANLKPKMTILYSPIQ